MIKPDTSVDVARHLAECIRDAQELEAEIRQAVENLRDSSEELMADVRKAFEAINDCRLCVERGELALALFALVLAHRHNALILTRLNAFAMDEIGGLCLDVDTAYKLASTEPSRMATKAAYARHAGDYLAKNKVRSHYLLVGEKYKSMDAAAEAIAGTIVNYSFRTVRKWITEFARELREQAR